MSRTFRVGCICIFSALGSLLFGMDMGYIGPIIEDTQFKQDVGVADMSSVTEGFVVSVFALGCILFAFPLLSGWFLSRLGRKVSLMVGSLIFMTGSILQAAATSVALMVVGRFVSGCSVGILSTVVPLYQSELAPPHLRGALTASSQVMITVGVLVATFADEQLLHLHSGWRLAILVPVLPASVLFVGMFFMPRSPRWLVQQGRKQEALRVLRSIREEDEAIAELEEIALEQESASLSGEPRWSDLCSGRVGRLLVVGIVLQVLQQFTGINVFVSFGPRIWRSLGLDAKLVQTLMSATLFAATVPAMCLIDRFGRRSLLIAGAVGMLLANIVMSVLGLLYTHQEDGKTHVLNHAAGTAIAASAFFFVINFSYSWGPTTWVYCAEIFPLKVRGPCVGLTTMAEWMGVFVINQMTPILLSAMGFATFILLAAFSLAALLLGLWLPETKGVRLEQMDRIFDAKLGEDGTGRDTGKVQSKAHQGGAGPDPQFDLENSETGLADR